MSGRAYSITALAVMCVGLLLPRYVGPQQGVLMWMSHELIPEDIPGAVVVGLVVVFPFVALALLAANRLLKKHIAARLMGTALWVYVTAILISVVQFMIIRHSGDFYGLYQERWLAFFSLGSLLTATLTASIWFALRTPRLSRTPVVFLVYGLVAIPVYGLSAALGKLAPGSFVGLLGAPVLIFGALKEMGEDYALPGYEFASLGPALNARSVTLVGLLVLCTAFFLPIKGDGRSGLNVVYTSLSMPDRSLWPSCPFLVFPFPAAVLLVLEGLYGTRARKMLSGGLYLLAALVLIGLGRTLTVASVSSFEVGSVYIGTITLVMGLLMLIGLLGSFLFVLRCPMALRAPIALLLCGFACIVIYGWQFFFAGYAIGGWLLLGGGVLVFGGALTEIVQVVRARRSYCDLVHELGRS